MIESIEFQNFKVLRRATLPLGQCTILVGPNGSGKSTVLQALQVVRGGENLIPFQSVAAKAQKEARILIKLHFRTPSGRCAFFREYAPGQRGLGGFDPPQLLEEQRRQIQEVTESIRIFALDARAVAQLAKVRANPELAADGGDLAAVLDHMRDTEPERFERLTAEFCRWLPEFQGIRFEKPVEGHKAIALQVKDPSACIPAKDLSQGTLLALAILTLAYLPQPPSLVGLEEPDRGLHPRLLRHLRDAIYRLAHPQNFGEEREPVQVIATTHSPYFLDQFRDHPEDVVIAERRGDNVWFQRLSDREDIEEILGEAPLGEVWYTGVLGGVPGEG